MDDGNFGGRQREDQPAKFLGGIHQSPIHRRGKFYAEALQTRRSRVRSTQARRYPWISQRRLASPLKTSIVSVPSPSDGAVKVLSN
jgi:hypothetical protein